MLFVLEVVVFVQLFQRFLLIYLNQQLHLFLEYMQYEHVHKKALDDARERLTAESLAAKGAFFYQRVEDNAFHVVDLRS